VLHLLLRVVLLPQLEVLLLRKQRRKRRKRRRKSRMKMYSPRLL